jgi:hypothetical protein
MEVSKAMDEENLGTILGGLGQADVRTVKSVQEMAMSSRKLPLTPETSQGSTQVQREPRQLKNNYQNPQRAPLQQLLHGGR